jgi:hypothetical protein
MTKSSSNQTADVRSRIRTPALRSLFDYWNKKRGEQRFMLRSQLEPGEITPLLPLVFILEVQREPRRYLIRLMGTEIATRFGGDYTGRYMDELDLGTIKKQVLAGYDHVVDHVEPHLEFAEFTQRGRGRMQVERLALPMSTDGLTVDLILGSVIHVPLSALGLPKTIRKAPWRP